MWNETDRSIVITGGAGFIGSHVVNKFKDNGYKVYIIDKLTEAACLSNVNEYDDILVKDVRSPEATRFIRRIGPDYVFHLAAESHVDRSIKDNSGELETWRTNVEGSVRMAKAAKSVHALYIHVSTDEIYGSNTEDGRGYDETDLPDVNPNNIYAVSKLAGETAVREIMGKDFIIFRPCNLFGPHQDISKLTPKIVINLTRNKNVKLYGEGFEFRQWLYVKDGVNLMFEHTMFTKNYTCGDRDKIYNIVGPWTDTYTNNQWVEKIGKIMKVRPEIEYIQPDPRGDAHDTGYKIYPGLSVAEGIVSYHTHTHMLDYCIEKTIKYYQNMIKKG